MVIKDECRVISLLAQSLFKKPTFLEDKFQKIVVFFYQQQTKIFDFFARILKHRASSFQIFFKL
jgi:hypothetical protein